MKARHCERHISAREMAPVRHRIRRFSLRPAFLDVFQMLTQHRFDSLGHLLNLTDPDSDDPNWIAQA